MNNSLINKTFGFNVFRLLSFLIIAVVSIPAYAEGNSNILTEFVQSLSGTGMAIVGFAVIFYIGITLTLFITGGLTLRRLAKEATVQGQSSPQGGDPKKGAMISIGSGFVMLIVFGLAMRFGTDLGVDNANSVIQGPQINFGTGG